MEEKVGNLKISFPNLKEFRILKDEIFRQKIYEIELGVESPLVLDIGAYIGMATLFFKSIYPDVTIIAVEPNPEAVGYLQRNLLANSAKSVEVLPKAVSVKGERIHFYIDGTDQGWNSTGSVYEKMWTGKEITKKIEVESITLDQLIGESEIDLLKMDVEGAEWGILRNSEKIKSQVQHIILEYHPVKESRLGKIVKMLRSYGFSLEVLHEGMVLDWDEIAQYQNSLLIIRGSKSNR